MVDKLDVILKCIILLYREKILQELTNTSSDNSIDMVKTILGIFANDKRQLIGGDAIVTNELEDLLRDMCLNLDKFNKEMLLTTASIILREKDSIFKILEKAINIEMEISGLKTSIVSLRKFLNIYYKETEATNLIRKASYQLVSGNLNVPFNEFLTGLIGQLDALNMSVTKSKDPGVISSLDFWDEKSIEDTVEIVQEYANDTGKFITGWKAVNRMINGSFRRGEMWCISALQHNYKSGLLQSLFVQFCTLNKPALIDPNKKPMVLLISFEDDANIIMEFMYRYMWFNEYGEVPDLKVTHKKDMVSYIKNKLSINGFYPKIIRASPSEWTYKNVFNTVTELEAEGYEIQALIIDYLSKLPTTYCDNSGPVGTALRDLFTRVRDMGSAKNILVLTAHQISTEALQLKRAGIEGKEFIDEITSKNYYSDSKQIPQVLDGEIYIVKSRHNGRWALFLGKGKHRSPVITADKDKTCVLMFPKGAPIPEDLNKEESLDMTDYSDSGDELALL